MFRFSIITPCRNAEKTIERTILSVANQNYKNLEYIIVDGLSTDSTIEIAQRYESKFPSFKVISEKDNSMTEALNKGIALATGDIIASINADDEYMPNILPVVAKTFEESGADGVIGDTLVLDDESKQVLYETHPKFANSYFLHCLLDCFSPESSVFFRKQVFNEIGKFDERIKFTQDYEFYLRFTSKGKYFAYLPEEISKFYVSDSHLSTKLADTIMQEPMNYVGYKYLHYLFKRSSLSGMVKASLGLRSFPNGYLNHLFAKLSGRT